MERRKLLRLSILTLLLRKHEAATALLEREAGLAGLKLYLQAGRVELEYALAHGLQRKTFLAGGWRLLW